MTPIHVQHMNYIITTDKSLMHVEQIHQWLTEKAYWSKGIPFHLVKSAFDNSFCIGVLSGTEQVGYGRLITDQTTFAYLADVYVLEEHRGNGLGKLMMQTLFDLDWVKGLRRIMLATTDAHELYRKIGFTPLQHPEKIMELSRPRIYVEGS